MAIKPDEEKKPEGIGAPGSSTRTSELDLTKRSTGPVWRQYLRAMGPGLVTGASDDDPSGIATYAQAGAQYGLSFLWAALLTLPLMVGVQEICDRTALATGTGLGELAVKRFHRAGRSILAVLLVALIVANALNIAADLVAIGSGMQLLQAGPTWLWALVAGALITTLLVLGSFARIALVFKVLCAALLAYLVVAVLVTHQWGSVFSHTFVPHLEFNKTYLALLVAVLGTTISPTCFLAERSPLGRDARRTRGRRPGSASRTARARTGQTQAAHESPRCVYRHDVLEPGHVRHHRGHRRDPPCPR